MHLDVVDLRNFYYRSALGRAAQKAIRAQVGQLWPQVRGQTVAGFGFAMPLLRPFIGQARRVIALMPAPQGAMAWPPGQPNVGVLCEETRWPLDSGFVDRLICLHGLETSENPRRVLEECARCLSPTGRALLIVPNRGGLWSRRDATPFGFGRPYSLGQLEAAARRHGLEPLRHRAALFQPPSEGRFWRRTAELWERAGQSLGSRYGGGVLLLEVARHQAEQRRPGLPESVKTPIEVLDGIAHPDPRPV